MLNDLSLDEAQCEAYFPGLTKEIDEVVAEGPFEVKRTGDMGPLQGRIRNGQVRHSLAPFVVRGGGVLSVRIVDGVG